MHCTTTVKLVLADDPDKALSDVQVSLFDRDSITSDDLLGSETTDAEGEACFRYGSEKYLDLDDRMSGEDPELFAVVYDSDGQVVVTTRKEAFSGHRRQMTVAVQRDLAERHKLVTTG